MVQQRRFQHGAGGNHPDDAPFHDAPAGGGVAQLLADCHLVALPDEPGQVGVQRHHGDAGQGYGGVAFAHRTRGQGDFQRRRQGVGILVKALVKIAHPKEQDGVRVGMLNRQPLPAHRGQPAAAARPGQCRRPGQRRRSSDSSSSAAAGRIFGERGNGPIHRGDFSARSGRLLTAERNSFAAICRRRPTSRVDRPRWLCYFVPQIRIGFLAGAWFCQAERAAAKPPTVGT